MGLRAREKEIRHLTRVQKRRILLEVAVSRSFRMHRTFCHGFYAWMNFHNSIYKLLQKAKNLWLLGKWSITFPIHNDLPITSNFNQISVSDDNFSILSKIPVGKPAGKLNDYPIIFNSNISKSINNSTDEPPFSSDFNNSQEIAEIVQKKKLFTAPDLPCHMLQ